MHESLHTTWWREFFDSPLWIEVQKATWSEEVTKSDTLGVEKLLGLDSPSRVLDVPCGNGRISVELARKGHEVAGVDFSREILDRAAERARDAGCELTLEHRDMRDLPWKAEFDGAVCLWGSIGYFDEAGNTDFLRAVSGALKPGAKFLIDTHSLETLLPRFEEREKRQVGEVFITEERSFDVVRSRVDVQWTLTHEGRTDMLLSSIRLYSYRELCDLLGDAGFTDCQGYGRLDGEPFDLGSPRLVLTATKT